MPTMQLVHLRLGSAEGDGKKPENQETCCEIVSPTKDKETSPMISQPDGCVSKAQRTPPSGILILKGNV